MVIVVIIRIYNIDKKIIIIEKIMEIWSLKNNNKTTLTLYQGITTPPRGTGHKSALSSFVLRPPLELQVSIFWTKGRRTKDERTKEINKSGHSK